MIIQIIGVGSVGSSIAFGILLFKSRGYLTHINKIYLNDKNEKKLLAELLDLRRAKEILCVPGLMIDKTRMLKGADVNIICAGKRRTIFEGQTNEYMYAKNWETISDIMKKLFTIDPYRRIIIVTNPAKEFAEKYKVEYAGDKCDRVCSAKKIIEGKGYTNWGITAEILNML